MVSAVGVCAGVSPGAEFAQRAVCSEIQEKHGIGEPGGIVICARGIGDPNFIMVREDGSYLVTDDATADIYADSPERSVSLYTTAVSHSEP